jgi:serpin B
MSPFSISTALAMTWAGAKGETAAQMAKVLHLDGPADRAVDIAGSLVASYGAPDSKVTVRIANRLFGEKSYAFEQPFLSRLQTAFGAPLEPLDFKTAMEPSRARINGWVAGQTQDRIKDLVPPGGVDKDTRLALVNAIYFLGDWAVPFEKNQTRDEPLFATKGEKKDVPTMHQAEHLHFAATDGVKVLELPYQNGALAMDLVLPDAVDGLDALEARLTPAVLDKWIGAAQSDKVIVSLPKFEIAPQASLSLAPTLAAMGMPRAFDRHQADFTGIANPKDPEDRLYISAVFHKGFIKVDEKGTEAAAASAVMMARAGAAAPATPPKEFKADHPFLYLLRDTRTGLVLFMGRVADPSSR